MHNSIDPTNWIITSIVLPEFIVCFGFFGGKMSNTCSCAKKECKSQGDSNNFRQRHIHRKRCHSERATSWTDSVIAPPCPVPWNRLPNIGFGCVLNWRIEVCCCINVQQTQLVLPVPCVSCSPPLRMNLTHNLLHESGADMRLAF